MLLLLCPTVLFAQNGVLIDYVGTTRDNSAILDVRSTTQGMLAPRMNRSQRNLISSPATGLLIFQTDFTPGYYYNLGTPGTPQWERLVDPTTIPAGDNLGNHIASQNVRLTNNWLSNDGGNEGIQVNNSGNVQITGSGTIGLTTLANGWLKIGTTLAMDENQIHFGADGHIGTIGAFDLIFRSNGAEQMRLDDNGDFGIGVANPTSQLHTDGTVRFENYTNGFLQVDGSGILSTATGSGLFTAGSGLAWSGTNLNSVWSKSGTTVSPATSGDDIFLPTGSTLEADDRIYSDAGITSRTEGNNVMYSFGDGTDYAYASSVSGTGDVILRRLTQLRFGDNNDYDWNKWAGIAYEQANTRMIIGGPSSSFFTSNASPSNIDVIFDGVDGVGIGTGTTAPDQKLDVNGGLRVSSSRNHSELHNECQDVVCRLVVNGTACSCG